MREIDGNIFNVGELALAVKFVGAEVLYTTTNYASQGYYFYGGHLATSTSAEKNEFLKSLIPASTRTYLGGQKINDTCQWITGEEWNYTNFSSNSSSNYCLFMNASGEWNSNSNIYSTPYICEWDYDIRETRKIHSTVGLTSTA